MARQVSVAEASANFGGLLETLDGGQPAVIVEREGCPVGVLISPTVWEQYLRSLDLRFERAIDRLQERNRDADPEEVERIVAETVEEVRRERYEQRQHNAGRGP